MESTKNSPENKGKKWLFMCFRPVATIDDRRFKPLSHRGKTTDSVLRYFAVSEKESVALPAILSSAFTAAEGSGEESGSRLKNKGRDSSLRRALKAALKETSLIKKIISRRKTNKDKYLSKSSGNLEGESGKINSACKNTDRTHSNFSSSFRCSPAFTSSFSASSSCSSRTDQASGSSSEIYTWRSLSLPTNRSIGVTKHKQDDGVEDNRNKGYYGSDTAVCMLLVSLLLLIMWGKFVAILFTSIWFYLTPPGQMRRPLKEGGLCGESEFDSVQYKKKIVMEGLLERSHSRSLMSLASMPSHRAKTDMLRRNTV